ncbi:MAG: hypothetical protein Q7U49_13875 [Rhodoferax sp.]|uniref:hypothetical protein n=1 Tax=Rhodoferax sp. TaxID=50421 RepID=UPI002720D127|nr:hypothetical protein [Rhodoferax sp.]MDO9145381.1 hypothetical protein [Rhodoferax sp.]MDP1942508.1 hypothetical protein [Rhodoferax sp.]MDZ4206210.1 hypothetical protein [Rhodoferax sp.]
MKTFVVRDRIITNLAAVGKMAATVDDAFFELTVTPDGHLGQHDRILDQGMAVHMHAVKKHAASHAGT